MRKFILGFIIALLLPFMIDWIVFGSFTPCKAIQSFEDGSTIQACSVRG